MRVLHLIVAGLIAVFAVLGVLLAAVVVIFTGLVAYVLQFFRRGPGQTPSPERRVSRPTDDVIDVESTDVPDKPAGP